MIVYCDIKECRNNRDGECNNRRPTGVDAIRIGEAWPGRTVCMDLDFPDEDGGEE